MKFLNQSKKREEPLARLSEKEIQQKLYGGFYTGAEGLTSAPKPSSRQEHPQKAASPRPVLNTVAPATPDTDEDIFTQSRFVRETTPSQPEKKSEEASTELPKAPPVNVPPYVRPGSRLDGTSFRSTAAKPAEAMRTAKKSVYKAATSLKLPKLPFPNVGEPLRKLVSVLLPGLRAVASVIFKLMIQATQSLAEFVYYRRQGLKKMSLCAFAILGVLALFSGVHFLNVRREEAMTQKPAPRVQQETQAQSVSVVPVVPVESAPSPAVQSAEVLPVVVPTAATGEGEGKYVVQVATYFSEADAVKVASEMKSGDWPSFIRSVPRSDGKVFYSVYFGRFQDYQQAQEVLNRFRKTDVAGPFQDAFIRKLRE
jgi:hypothetical protein